MRDRFSPNIIPESSIRREVWQAHPMHAVFEWEQFLKRIAHGTAIDQAHRILEKKLLEETTEKEEHAMVHMIHLDVESTLPVIQEYFTGLILPKDIMHIAKNFFGDKKTNSPKEKIFDFISLYKENSSKFEELNLLFFECDKLLSTISNIESSKNYIRRINILRESVDTMVTQMMDSPEKKATLNAFLIATIEELKIIRDEMKDLKK